MKTLITGGSGFIGTNYVDLLMRRQAQIVNVDTRPPLKDEHRPYWRAADIMDEAALAAIFSEVGPQRVVHLAARTDTDSDVLDDYDVNMTGTANVLAAIASTSAVERAVITSTQFVLRPGKLPRHDEDFDPHTVYGQSKVVTEQLTRNSELGCPWTIVRPTNIWGPWHPRYPSEFWRVVSQGRYVHPGRAPVIRCYGYVKNVIHQIEQILQAPAGQVDGRVFYVGDRPTELLDWVDGFSVGLTGKNVRIVPRAMVRAMAWVGDAVRGVGLNFPIYSSRYHSMTEDYPTPMEATFEAFGEPPYSLQEGIRETVEGLKTR